MKTFTFILFAISMSSFGQVTTRNLASLHEQIYLQALVSGGVKDFYVVEKTCYGSLYRGTNDSCQFRPRETFIFIQVKDSSKYLNVVVFDECGEQWSLKTKSEAIDYYVQERAEILKRKLDYEVMINHVCRLNFYEIKNGEVDAESTFCDAEVKIDENKETKGYNEGLKLYKFFSILTMEMERLKNAR